MGPVAGSVDAAALIAVQLWILKQCGSLHFATVPLYCKVAAVVMVLLASLSPMLLGLMAGEPDDKTLL